MLSDLIEEKLIEASPTLKEIADKTRAKYRGVLGDKDLTEAIWESVKSAYPQFKERSKYGIGKAWEELSKPPFNMEALPPQMDVKANPILGNIQAAGRAGLEGFNEIFNVPNAILMAASGGLSSASPTLSKLISGYFGTEMGKGAIENYGDYLDAVKKDDVPRMWSSGMKTAMTGSMAGEALNNMAGGAPVREIAKELSKATDGSLESQIGTVGRDKSYPLEPKSGTMASEPKIYVRPSDLEESSSWGDKFLTHKTSREVFKGNPISKEQVPDILYHVTTNAPGVESTGMIRGATDLKGGLGKGTSLTHQGVSTTSNRNVALGLKRDILRAGEIARGDDTFENLITKYALEDSKSSGVPLDRAREESIKWLSVNKKSPNNMLDAYKTYLRSRESSGGQIDPILFGSADDFVKVNPQTTDVLAIRKNDIPNEALIRKSPVGNNFMDEIMIHSDIPVNEKSFVSKIRQGTMASDDLISQAKKIDPLKYKTAEEFVKAQGEVVSHGSTGESITRNPVGRYYAEEEIAKKFGDITHDAVVPPNRLLNITDAKTVGEMLDKTGGFIDINPFSPIQRETTIKELGSQYKALEMMISKETRKKLIDGGFLGIKFLDKTGGKKHPTTVLFRETLNEVPSKSQLIDEWNQAHGVK